MSDDTGPVEVTDDEARDEPETGPHLVLELEGERSLFVARAQKANQFLLVKYLDGLSQPDFRSTQAVTRLVLGQVADTERPRLEAYLERHGFDPGYDSALYSALEACWKGETMLPLARPSDS